MTSRRTSFKVDCLHHDQGEETSYYIPDTSTIPYYISTHEPWLLFCYPPVSSHPAAAESLSCRSFLPEPDTHTHTDRFGGGVLKTRTTTSSLYYIYTHTTTNGTSVCLCVYCLQLGQIISVSAIDIKEKKNTQNKREAFF